MLGHLMGNAQTHGKLSVQLRSANGHRHETSSVWNISLGGLFLELPEPLPFGEDVELELAMANQPRPLVCKGFVVWSTKDSPEKGRGKVGAAIRLTEVGIAEMRSIAAQVGQDL